MIHLICLKHFQQQIINDSSIYFGFKAYLTWTWMSRKYGIACLCLSVELSTHGVRLAGPGLAVSKASGHATLENVLDKRSRRISEN